nr:MAG TPA: hypothetical protein [Caudoviricetes sp.]
MSGITGIRKQIVCRHQHNRVLFSYRNEEELKWLLQ